MAILKLQNGATELNGRLAGNIITSSGLRGVARVRVRPASTLARQHWQPPFSLADAKSDWANLSTATQEEWEDYAAANVTWPIQGSPRYTDGETCFANYLTVLRLINPLAAIPAVPLTGPTWQSRPKFFEFAEWISDVYTIKAETVFAIDTQLLFSAMPPSPTVFTGQFFGEKIVGSNIFTLGLSGNEEFGGLHTMIENEFGSIDSTQKIWGRIWEVDNGTGHIRVIKDPCTPDPGVIEEQYTVTFTIANESIMDAVSSSVNIEYLGGTKTGEVDIGTINAGITGSGTITLDVGADLDDVDAIYWAIEWTDSSTDSLTEYGDGSSEYDWSAGGGPPPPP